MGEYPAVATRLLAATTVFSCTDNCLVALPVAELIESNPLEDPRGQPHPREAHGNMSAVDQRGRADISNCQSAQDLVNFIAKNPDLGSNVDLRS